MKSVWKDEITLPKFDSLKKDIKTDVLIIGGGISGILCAYMFAEAGIDYVLVEANTICSGVTGNTTAKITSQHGLLYNSLVREFGTERARMYLDANEEALQKYRNLCKNIECSFEDKDSYVYTRDNFHKIDKELEALKKIGSKAVFAANLPLPFPIAGSVKFESQAQFQPLQFIREIVQGLNIYEHTPVMELGKNEALTKNAKIRAERFVVASHFPILNKHGSYFIKMYQHRSYVMAFKQATMVEGMYMDEDRKGLSFRNYGELLIVGGGAGRTGKKCGGWQEVEEFVKKRYPDAKEQYRWAAQDCMTLDKVPYIGQYSKRTPNLYVASGFNKWGMTSSMISAMLLTDLLLEKKNPYQTLFSPSRTILRPQLFVNSFEAVTNLVRLSKRRCPHMGCTLQWNKKEKSWDCPCHGSRFTEEGKLINNPATGDLKSDTNDWKRS